MENKIAYATLGGGCFWCVEACFYMLKGVLSVVSGYAGGGKENPTYEEVCSGGTGHAEVVHLKYDPNVISYLQIMEVFLFLHDPTQLNRQGNDIGTQYRSVVFYSDQEQKIQTEKALEISQLKKEWKGEYVTQLLPFEKFWPAEVYHQEYYKNNPHQPYCSTVVGPKIRKFKKYFGDKGWLK
ncbi:peptide-methionine (S)-S-oxide reductase MsrA [Elizabethkingia argentiflava]|uniref:Peptide methionine sulfoxide reductase MsrA n=1 Tax=Elizabethkingia argenteiflava TaxID=2681556 RepID=A0A845PZF2_9FLAO|nr:peptide-methionine (S)-S-oxide reductase MsrA [Elizabethkingia argenteiflava]NAW52281.1 peptide-methionine (S)-S-oxide reductase MsrA [Elizabethkingia argenteiflava]